MGFSTDTPWRDLPPAARDAVLHGLAGKELEFKIGGKRSTYTWKGSYEGVVPMLERRYRDNESPSVRAEWVICCMCLRPASLPRLPSARRR